MRVKVPFFLNGGGVGVGVIPADFGTSGRACGRRLERQGAAGSCMKRFMVKTYGEGLGTENRSGPINAGFWSDGKENLWQLWSPMGEEEGTLLPREWGKSNSKPVFKEKLRAFFWRVVM